MATQAIAFGGKKRKIIIIFCFISPNLIAWNAYYVTVVELKIDLYCLQNTVFDFWPKLLKLEVVVNAKLKKVAVLMHFNLRPPDVVTLVVLSGNYEAYKAPTANKFNNSANYADP